MIKFEKLSRIILYLHNQQQNSHIKMKSYYFDRLLII